MASMFLRIGQNFGLYYCRKLYRNNTPFYRFVQLSTSNTPPQPALNLQNNTQKNVCLQQILAEVGEKKLTDSDAVNILTTLSRLSIKREIDPQDVKNDEKFKLLCRAFEKESRNMPSFLLVKGLRSLLELNVDPFSKLIDSIENEVLWQSRTMNIKTLNVCLEFHARFQESEYQKQVVKEIIAQIQKRWIEINSASEIIITLRNSTHFKDDFLCKVEDKALELVGFMATEEIYAMFCILPYTGRRPKPLLHALAYHLNQKNEKVNLKQAADLFYSLCVLNFPDTVLMQMLTNNILSEITKDSKGRLISAILKSCGILKWRHTGLIDACCDWLKNNAESLCIHELVTPVSALAHLNYKPEDEAFLQNFQKLDKTINNEIWLDVVWSLCILGKVNEEQLKIVLNRTIYQPLISFPDYRSLNNKLKILNINAVAKIEFPTSSAYSEKIFSDIEQIRLEKGKDSNKIILESLTNFLPRGKFMATNLQTTLGFQIDAEFIMDAAGKPVSLLDYGIKAGLDQEIKTLPQNCQRFALLVWDFKDVTLNTVSPTGINALAVRLLKKLGYTVLEIHQSEFNSNTTAVKRVQYLQRKINEKVKELKK